MILFRARRLKQKNNQMYQSKVLKAHETGYVLLKK